MHAQFDPLRRAPGDAQQLDAVAQLLGVADVFARQLGDAFGIGLVELHRNAEGDRRHDGELVRGVDAFDVEGRVGLGIAQLLRLLERGIERQPLVAHLRQDEVGGAVDDAGDPFDAVGGQAFAQRLDDRDAAGDRRLERDHHALLLRRGEDLGAVRGQQRLVGGDDVLAVGDGLQHQLFRDRIAADQLDHDVDVRIRYNFIRIGGDSHPFPRELARLLQVAIGDHANDDAAAGAARDFFLVAFEHGKRAAADGADAEQAYFDGFHSVSNCYLDKSIVRPGDSTLFPSAVLFSLRIRCPSGCSAKTGAVTLAVPPEEISRSGPALRSGRRCWAGRRRGNDPCLAS